MRRLRPTTKTNASATTALHDWFSSASVDATLGDAGRDVPAELWQRALLGPADQFLSQPGKALRAEFMRTCARVLSEHADASVGIAAPAASVAPELLDCVEVLHAGSLIIDDIEDESTHRRGKPALHVQVGLPIALNCGNWMYFWSMALLRKANLRRNDQAMALIENTLLRCHHGQALDLACAVDLVEPAHVARTVHAIATLKTGALFRLAAGLVAIAAEVPDAASHTIMTFAEGLGVALQRFDDTSSLVGSVDSHKQYEDLLQRRLTWPLAVLSESHPEDYHRIATEISHCNRESAPRLAQALHDSVGEASVQRARDELEKHAHNLTLTFGERAKPLLEFSEQLRSHYDV